MSSSVCNIICMVDMFVRKELKKHNKSRCIPPVLFSWTSVAGVELRQEMYKAYKKRLQDFLKFGYFLNFYSTLKDNMKLHNDVLVLIILIKRFCIEISKYNLM